MPVFTSPTYKRGQEGAGRHQAFLTDRSEDAADLMAKSKHSN